MARTFGFACDRLRRATLIDASGAVLEVDEDHEGEVFWALRGGQPDLGIITEVEIDLLPVPSFYGGGIFYSGAAAEAVLHAFGQWAPELPESVTTSIALLRLPNLPSIPEVLRGALTVHLRFVHVGDDAKGAALLAPMRAAAPALIDAVERRPAGAIAAVHQDPTDPMPAREEGIILTGLPPAAIDALLTAAGPDAEVPLIIVELRLMGGALSRNIGPPSAVNGRDGAFNATMIGPYPPPLRPAVDAASASVLTALRPWADGTRLVNFLGNGTAADDLRAACPEQTRHRLERLKQEWDPGSRFRFAHSWTQPPRAMAAG